MGCRALEHSNARLFLLAGELLYQIKQVAYFSGLCQVSVVACDHRKLAILFARVARQRDCGHLFKTGRCAQPSHQFIPVNVGHPNV